MAAIRTTTLTRRGETVLATSDAEHQRLILAGWTPVAAGMPATTDAQRILDLQRQVAALAGGGTAKPSNASRAPLYASSVSNRAAGRSLNNTSAVAVQTTRVRHVITEDCAGISLVFTGWFNNELPQTVDATIKASVEVGGQVIPVHFNGERTRVLRPSALVTSDLLGVNLRKGDVVWVRAARTIVPGTWGANCQLLGLGAGEGVLDSDSVDAASSAFVAAGSDTVTAWTAHAVVSPGVTAGRSVAIIGDSISNGQNETVRELGGYMLRSLPDSVGVIRANNSGGTAKQYVINSTNAGSSLRRLPLALSAKYAWVEFGINDINGGDSAAVVKANLLRLWTALDKAGLKVVQSTLTVWGGGSTDAYLTAAGQTVWARHAVRTEVNDWIRSKPAPLHAVLDMADAVESARNSGRWKDGVGGVALTTDGIHPSTLGSTVVADALRGQAAAIFV